MMGRLKVLLRNPRREMELVGPRRATRSSATREGDA